MVERIFEVGGVMTKEAAVRVVEIPEGIRLVIAKEGIFTSTKLSAAEAEHIAWYLSRFAAKVFEASEER